MDASCDYEERVSYDANDLAEMLIAPPDPIAVRSRRLHLDRCLIHLNAHDAHAGIGF